MEEPRVYVSIDLQSQEIYVTAFESKDPVMMDAFLTEPRKDLHSTTGAGLVPFLMPRLGGPTLSEMSYEDFISAYRDEKHELNKYVSEIRQRYAKACIAEGSLVLTDSGLVPIEQVTTSHKVWDGVEWVTHDGVVYKGLREVIEYDGLTATPDHVVYTANGERSIFLKASERKDSLAIGESKGKPASYIYNSGSPDILKKRKICSSSAMRSLSDALYKGSWKHFFQPNKLLQTLQKSMLLKKRQKAFVEIFSNEESLRKSKEQRLSTLRRKGHQSAVRLFQGVQRIYRQIFAECRRQRNGDRQNRQQRKLLSWKFTGSNSPRKLIEHQKGYIYTLLWPSSQGIPCLGYNQTFSPGIPIHKIFNNNDVIERGYRRRAVSQKDEKHMAKVYDIINAGPRSRFTVSGKVVANCNFTLTYLGTSHTSAENLLIPKDMADGIMDGAMALYKRLPIWQQEMIEFAKAHGYTQTAYGNRRHATKELWSNDQRDVSRMGRQLVNAIVQGGSADILKVIRQSVRERNIVQRYALRSVMPIYDEWTASVPLRLAKDYILEMVPLMRITPPGYPVALDVDVEVGFSWGEQKEFKDLSPEGIEKSLQELSDGRT